ncbi:ATP-binding protein [uncultured Desulfobacter sp.]|uniref:hybrid sensor histidine kinase/response regulator n=1 Tax=uncultured Desulfobacter sp. TaxID=240139 RepID=UPI002AAB1577|nr:ATP-binding protein [uncultured Desulfobacter sp.]
METPEQTKPHVAARRKFLELSLESTRKSYYPLLKKQLERAREREENLQLLIDNLPALISYVDADLRYVLVNRAVEKAYGKNRDQIIGRQMKSVMGPHNYDKIESYVQDALSGRSGTIELILFNAANDGNRLYEVNYVPEMDTNGNVSGFYFLTIDITEKKQAEQERLKLKDRLRQAHKMEAIGTLSGGIAHDFNNILSGMFGYSQLLETYKNDPRKVEEYNRKIFESAQRASSLIQQILSFSRQSKINRHPIKLDLILKEALNLLRSSIPSTIEIKQNLTSRAKVLADPTQLHQVIMNLCTNAYHAMGDKGGTLTVALEEKTVSERNGVPGAHDAENGYLRLSVSDTGQGIDDRIKDKIFDPYFTTKKVGRGTGLGLAVVAGIVKKHNGYIEFETTLGLGTTFHIYLPVIIDETSGPEPLQAMEQKKETPASGRLMIVDDETSILEALEAFLTAKGYRVSIYDNGASALQMFQTAPDQFDLIITDMTMPRMAGDKFALAALKIRADIPIIMCSGYNEHFSKADALRAGIKKYIPKPANLSNLSATIRELLDKQPD